MSNESRRNFLKAGGAAAIGVAAATATGTPASAQTVKLNPRAKAVLPNGKELSRQQVLTQLGLDPSTPPDAWLSITTCGSNASALKPADLRGLVDRGAIKREMLDAQALQKLK